MHLHKFLNNANGVGAKTTLPLGSMHHPLSYVAPSETGKFLYYAIKHDQKPNSNSLCN
jgi:hypothetical protein